MVDTAKMAKLLERFAQGVASHDRENPDHNSWGIGMAHFDIERLDLEEGEEILPGIVLRSSRRSAPRRSSSRSTWATRRCRSAFVRRCRRGSPPTPRLLKGSTPPTPPPHLIRAHLSPRRPVVLPPSGDALGNAV
jgi:hypothetical protein